MTRAEELRDTLAKLDTALAALTEVDWNGFNREIGAISERRGAVWRELMELEMARRDSSRSKADTLAHYSGVLAEARAAQADDPDFWDRNSTHTTGGDAA